MRKAIKWILIIVPVVVIIAVVVVLLMLNSIVKRTVETQATASTNLQTSLSSASLSLLGGKLNLSGLQIASPKGFNSPEMFSMKDLGIQVDYSQLRTNPIHIQQIAVDGPHLILEQEGTNLNVKAAMDQMPKSESSSDTRLIIDTLQINNTQVTIKTNLPMVPPETNLTLPTITLKNIGNADGAQNGAAIKDVLSQVLSAMLEQSQQSAKLPGDLSKWLNTQNVQGQVQGEINKAKQDVQKQVDQQLKGLFNKK